MLMCATCGRGMNSLAIHELQTSPWFRRCFTLFPEETEIEGKIFFASTGEELAAQHLLKLRLIERLFFVIYREKPQLEDGWCSEEDIIEKLRKQVSGIQTTLNLWKENFSTNRKESVRRIYRKRKQDGCIQHEEHEGNEENGEGSADVIAVRVSVKVTGSRRSSISQDSVKLKAGSILSNCLTSPYQVVPGEADVTFNIMCSDRLLLFAIPLTMEPLSLRPYLKSYGLRSTTCAAMTLLAEIQPGQVVLDPLCGAATILIEACNTQPLACYTGVDINCTQLDKAVANMSFYSASADQPIHLNLVHGDVNNLCILEGSVDIIMTDLPFGKQHKVIGSIERFYIQCCSQFSKVLSGSGKLVVLTSEQLLDTLKKSAASTGLLVDKQHYITLGRTGAFIVCMHKKTAIK